MVPFDAHERQSICAWLSSFSQIEHDVRKYAMNLPQDVAIRISDLSKMYKIYDKPADMFWELLTSKM